MECHFITYLVSHNHHFSRTLVLLWNYIPCSCLNILCLKQIRLARFHLFLNKILSLHGPRSSHFLRNLSYQHALSYSRKNPHTPDEQGRFCNLPSHLDFLKHKTSPPVWISKTKDPPPAWISGKNY